MNVANCPRCNMYLTPGAEICPNCQLNLQHPDSYRGQFQQPQPYGAPAYRQPQTSLDSPESRKEKAYKKLLVAIAIVLMGEFLVYRIPGWLYSWFGASVYSLMRPIEWVLSLAWAGLPLLVALMLPKTNGSRVVLIIFGSIYALAKLITFVYEQFVYDPYPPVYFNF